jgi:hypothetical protein
MPRTSNLASLERQLVQINTSRARVIAAIRQAVDRVTSDGSFRSVRLEKPAIKKASRRKRRFSKAARAKLAAAARKRWAEAKKAGQTKLG